jgi:hypothetical protein
LKTPFFNKKKSGAVYVSHPTPNPNGFLQKGLNGASLQPQQWLSLQWGLCQQHLGKPPLDSHDMYPYSHPSMLKPMLFKSCPFFKSISYSIPDLH